ncbi:MAG: tetratricopeptide repeat protein [Candidatus Marinimicrobia bacterium]|nr:tetratricopeptide repeat protein [Candidatus Neomarinimicrobiota bacterium]
MNSLGVAASMIGLFMLINFMFLRIGYADKDETPSIAILPFENKGAEADDFYAYGISSDLITDVTGAGLIRVASMGDIEKLDYNNLENNELAKKLFVRYVAKGTLWKMDSVFQLSMEIFDTKSSKVVYNKRWETAWKDLATIKDDLSDNILETLKIEVLRDVEDQIVESNPEAYEYYLKAKYKLRNRKNIEDIEVARGLLNKAIKLNNNLIPAKNLLGTSYEIIGEYDKALDIFNSNFKQAKEFDDKNQIYFTQKRIGDVYSSKGEYDNALAYYEKSLLIAEEIDSKSGIGSLLSEIGVVNFYRGNYDIALENWEKSLAIAELLEDKDLISQNVFNIGNSYWVKGDHDKALENYKKRLAMQEELGEKAGLSTTLNNLGNVYSYKGDLETALGYFERALVIDEELGNKEGMGWIFRGMQGLYYNKGDYDLALDYAERSLKICEKIGDKRGLSGSVEMFGYFYYINGEYGKAVEYLERSLSLNDELGLISDYKISSTVYLYLIYKNLDKEYDEQKILSLLESVEKIGYDTNFRLYELLEDKSYLENAYKKIQERTDAMSDELKQKFLNYPIPKQIIQEWEGVS